MNLDPRNSKIPALQGFGYLADNALAGAALPVAATQDVGSKALNAGNYLFGGDPNYFSTNRTQGAMNFGRTGLYQVSDKNKRLPIHTQPGSLNLKPSEKPYEDPGPPPMFSPQGSGDKPKIQALPDYNPQYENASRENYATQMGEMRGALDPRISQRGAITNELLNYRPSGGQSAAAALSLLFQNMGAQDSLATTAATQKGGLVPLNLQGIHFGNEARVYGQKERFKEGQESTQAQIGLHKAQTQKSIQDANTQKPQAALAGYMDEYLAGLKPEQRNEIVKSQLMGKKDNSNIEFDKTVYDIAKGLHEGKVSAAGIDPKMKAFLEAKGLMPVATETKKKGYFE